MLVAILACVCIFAIIFVIPKSHAQLIFWCNFVLYLGTDIMWCRDPFMEALNEIDDIN